MLPLIAGCFPIPYEQKRSSNVGANRAKLHFDIVKSLVLLLSLSSTPYFGQLQGPFHHEKSPEPLNPDHILNAKLFFYCIFKFFLQYSFAKDPYSYILCNGVHIPKRFSLDILYLQSLDHGRLSQVCIGGSCSVNLLTNHPDPRTVTRVEFPRLPSSRRSKPSSRTQTPSSKASCRPSRIDCSSTSTWSSLRSSSYPT